MQLEDIVKTSGLAKGILESVMDYVCTQGMAIECSPGIYQATPLTNMLLSPLFNDAVTHLLV